jgi:predicted ATPase
MADAKATRAMKVVIAGGTGTGKTSTLEALEKKLPGAVFVEESARAVVRQRGEEGRALLRRENKLELQEAIAKAQSEAFGAVPDDRLCIFDSGFGDTIAFLKIAGIAVPKELLEAARRSRYDAVFWAPPRRDIFRDGNTVNPQTWEHAEQLGLLIRDTYRSLGYTVIELPKAEPRERANFVIEQLERK